MDRRFQFLDLALVVVAILLFLSEAKILLFHLIFILLTVGAFFWNFRAFVWRAGFWVIVATSAVIVSVLSDKIPAGEIVEIPLLSIMLLLVFAIAGQRARAGEALRQALQDLSTLLEISRNVVLTEELKPLLELILDYLKDLVNYERATIYELEGDTLIALTYRGHLSAEEIFESPISLKDSPISDLLTDRNKPLIISDIWADTPIAQNFRTVTGEQLKTLFGHNRSWVGVPLTIKDRVIGILALQHREPDHYFSPRHTDLVLGFANQAALAMENARHYGQAQVIAAMEERQRLARDLHDAVSQTLFSASLSAEVLPLLWERNPIEARHCLEEVHQLTRSALAEMRTLLLELRPGALTEMELRDLLGQLPEAIGSRVRLPVTLVGDKLGPLPPGLKLALYRISQEALNNVAKHAEASQATVWLRCAPRLCPEDGGDQQAGLELRISDDGRGFDPQRIPAASLGLGIMRERAEAVGAEFKVESQIGSGTQVIVVWPGA